ncbi:MAG: winged helix-turn-helix domain-containing protein [Acidobacteria bacterium]|nr:winged helix-turn-helix domain-containing protein [Acidobacteriota bacterium]MCI0720338.1 winged helix-turn-helix domain-containing protein [Acidobacteriota bacterium]
MRKRANHLYKFGRFSLDAVSGLLWRDAIPVSIPPKAIDTLLLLVQNNGRVLRKDELMKALWPSSFVEESNLTQYIFLLRKTLEENPNEHRFIVTVPRRGYRFVGSVREIWDEGTASDIVMWSQSKPEYTVKALKAIAVLPFKPIAAEASDPYLGMGMADAIITKLSHVRGVRVRPTSAVLKYTNPGHDLRTVGRELGVDLVLDGRIQKVGESIRVTVQLVTVPEDSVLWAGKMEENFLNIFAVQDSVSEQVARALTLQLTAEEKRQLTKRYTESTEAYQAYLRGRYFWNKRSEEGFKKAIECFEKAIEADPGYALAFAGLADCYNLLSYYHGVAPKEVFPKARAAAAKAIEMDDQLAEAHASLGLVRADYDWDWQGAEEEYQKSIALNPTYAVAHSWYAEYLTAMGRHDEAMAEIQRAQQLDPLSLFINRDVGWVLYMQRQYDRAMAQLQDTLEIDPNFASAHWFLGWVYEQDGLLEEAIAEFRKSMSLSEGNSRMLAEIGYALARSGKRSEAQRVLEELKELSKRRYVVPYEIAIIYIGLGEKDQAFQWLDKTCEDRNCDLIFLRVEPKLDSLRSDARFADLIGRLGLSSSA